MPRDASTSLLPLDIGRRVTEALQVAARIRRARGEPTDPLARSPILCRTPAGPRPAAEVVTQLRSIHGALVSLLERMPLALPYTLDELRALSPDEPAYRLADGLCGAALAAAELDKALHEQIDRSHNQPPA